MTLYEHQLPWLGDVQLPAPFILVIWGVLEGLSLPLPMPGPLVLGALALAIRPTALQMAVFALYGSVGYCLGAAGAYWLGLKVREHPGIQRFLARIGLGPERLASLDRWFAKYGHWAVCWTRPFWIGNYLSLPAGIARMPFGRFLMLTFIGIYPAAYVFLWSGEEVAKLVDRYGLMAMLIASGVLGAILLIGYLWRRRRTTRRMAS